MSDSITSHPEDSVRSLISTTTTSNSILINKQNINKEELILERKEVIGYNVTVNFSKNPLVLLRGEGQYLYDEVSNSKKNFLFCMCNYLCIRTFPNVLHLPQYTYNGFV